MQQHISAFKKAVFYILLIGAFVGLMLFLLRQGSSLEVGRDIDVSGGGSNHWHDFVEGIRHNFTHPLAILLLQIAMIIITARIFGVIFKTFGQPSVVGEIIAGIFLGPSLLGKFFPEISVLVFPVQSLSNLQFLSQIGLILFMFVVGMELDLKVLRNKAHDAVVVSHASIVVPFTLGMGLSFFIYQSFAPPQVNFTSFALFMGIAMSITAFPVLARIIQERGIQKTRLGTIAITCAAADDITAWCILAVVIAIVKAGSIVSAIYVIILAVAYVFFMLRIVRPFLKRVGDLHASKENLSKPIVAIFFLTLILSSYLTEIIGIHALFGAFMTGTVIPENVRFRNLFIEKVEDVALVLLLPLFFVFTGLRTQIGLLDDPELWKVTGYIVLVAVVGKFAGSTFAAKFVGQRWKDSLIIGALMNTRGLMELVVLNIGYDLGILSPEIFAMMVIMALVTTMMTGPALDLINRIFDNSDEVPAAMIDVHKYKVLISFGNPSTGISLFKLANDLTKKTIDNASITAMHLSPVNELHHYNEKEFERDAFEPLIAASEKHNQPLTTLFKATNDIDEDIVAITNKGDFDLLLVGIGQSIFSGSLLGKVLGFTTAIVNPKNLFNKVTSRERLFDDSPFDSRTNALLNRVKIPVGVLVDNGFAKAERILLPVCDARDEFMLDYAQKFIHNADAQVIVLDLRLSAKKTENLHERVRSIEQVAPNHISLLQAYEPSVEFVKNHDLMLISVLSWKMLLDSKYEWLSYIPSVLILNK